MHFFFFAANAHLVKQSLQKWFALNFDDSLIVACLDKKNLFIRIKCFSHSRKISSSTYIIIHEEEASRWPNKNITWHLTRVIIVSTDYGKCFTSVTKTRAHLFPI